VTSINIDLFWEKEVTLTQSEKSYSLEETHDFKHNINKSMEIEGQLMELNSN